MGGAFTRRDLRRGLDVYRVSGDYAGSVLWVWGVKAAAVTTYPQRPVGTYHGEQSGPVPTHMTGNTGPANQPLPGRTHPIPPTSRTLGRLLVVNVRGVPRIWVIAASRVVTVSHERIVVE